RAALSPAASARWTSSASPAVKGLSTAACRRAASTPSTPSSAASALAPVDRRGAGGPSGRRVPNPIEGLRSRRRPPGPTASVGPEGLREAGEHGLAALARERGEVPGPELHPARDRVERGLDCRHRAATVAVDDRDVHAVPAELVGGGEPEPRRAAEDERPLIR